GIVGVWNDWNGARYLKNCIFEFLWTLTFPKCWNCNWNFSITQTRKKQILIFVHKPPVSFCTSAHEYSISEFFMDSGFSGMLELELEFFNYPDEKKKQILILCISHLFLSAPPPKNS
ncbi:hypothetical protein M5D96_011967, partial [Drosophila gunungcola]